MEAQISKADATELCTIIDLSTRVQQSLKASGSQQVFGPLRKDMVDEAILKGHCYVFRDGPNLVGSVIVAPMASDYLHLPQLQEVNLRQPFWILKSLMIDPDRQGKGLGLQFLSMITKLYRPLNGTISLDCWAGNLKLRDFYRRAGFKELGDVPEEDYYVTIFAKA